MKKDTSIFGLARMNDILTHCGNPHLKLRAVHIAGTKGKGSTAAILASILQQAGHKVGLYTSPHVLDIRERIQINGEWISEDDVTALLNSMFPYLQTAIQGGETYAPTFFEIFTTVAFLYFLQHGADIAVFEVGLGGRLDAPNVLLPEACAITPVSFDHTGKLGTDLRHIAGEKAGIIKTGVPVVSSVQQPEALDVIRAKCTELNTTLKVVGQDVIVETRPPDGFSIKTWRRELEGLTLPLRGRHQLENAATAAGVVELLSERGFEIADECVRRGIASVNWRGRIETASTNPETIVDGAHNPASITALTEVLDSLPRKKTIFVVGIAADKDIASMLELVIPRGDEFIFTKTANPRAAEPAHLKSLLQRVCHKPVYTAATPPEALELARNRADSADRICVTGSMYLAGEVLPIVEKEHGAQPAQTA